MANSAASHAVVKLLMQVCISPIVGMLFARPQKVICLRPSVKTNPPAPAAAWHHPHMPPVGVIGLDFAIIEPSPSWP
jgi:hypothetical protein